MANKEEPNTSKPRSSIPQKTNTKHSITKASIIFSSSSARYFRCKSILPLIAFSSNFLVTFNSSGKLKRAITVTISLYCVPKSSKRVINSKMYSHNNDRRKV